VEYTPVSAKVTNRKSEGDFYLVLDICEIGSAFLFHDRKAFPNYSKINASLKR